jgi:hypothetical protein
VTGLPHLHAHSFNPPGGSHQAQASAKCPIHFDLLKHRSPIARTVRRANDSPRRNGRPTLTELPDVRDGQPVVVFNLGLWLPSARCT